MAQNAPGERAADQKGEEEAGMTEGVEHGEAQPSPEDSSQTPSRAFADSGQTPMSEQEQEVEQWLSRVPDDPGGLLREKLRRRYAEKQGVTRMRQGGTTWQ